MHFDTIRGLVAEDLQATEQLINRCFLSDIPLINQVSQHLIASGGKRMRPLVVLLSAKAFNYQGIVHHQLAAIIELIHTATLLHDDVIDASELRRGRETANAVWGNQASVLVGDYLYSRAFQMMAEVKQLDIITVLANATNIIVEGEILQLINCGDPETTESRYMEVITRKTGALFGVAAHLGATLTHQSIELADIMNQFGQHLGIAFQLIDDALDYSSDAETLGKNCGDDLAEGKPTLPIIYALLHAAPAQQTLLRNAIQERDRQAFKIVLEAIEASNAIAYTYRAAKSHADKAIALLQEIPDSPYRQALIALAEFAVERKS